MAVLGSSQDIEREKDMKHVTHPEAGRLHTTENGIRMVVRSWPHPVRNRLGRITGYLFDSIYTSIEVDVYGGPADWKNPMILNGVVDLEDKVEGKTYAAELAVDLAKISQALGCPNDAKALQSKIYETRGEVIALGAADETI